MRKVVIPVLLILSTFALNSAFAKKSSSVTTYKHTNTHSASKSFSLEFLAATEQTKDIVDKSHDGTYSKFDVSLLQRLSPNDELRYFASTRYVDTHAEDFGNEFEFFFTELMYRRKNILTQSKNKLYLEAELKYVNLMNSETRERYGYDTYLIPQLIFKKSFGRKFSTKLKLRRHFYQSNNQDAYTLNHEDRIYLSGTAFLNRHLMFFTQLKYQHKIRKGEGLDYRFFELANFNTPSGRPDFSKVPTAKKNQEILTIHPSILMLIGRKSMIEFYVETKLSDSYDKRDLEQITKDEFVLGTAVYLTAF